MALDPRYVTAPSLQEYFVDKDSGLPLAGGKVFFYRDTNRTEPKSVYELQGNSANYTYVPLDNPVILSGVGTMQDNNGNDIIPYYYPFDAQGDVDLYYIVVQNSLGVPQFTRQAWPNPNVEEIPTGSDELINYIPNGQLLMHTDLPENALVGGSNVIAQGGFTFELPDPLPGPTQSVNTLEFIVEGFVLEPPQSPRYVMQVSCTTFNPLDTIKNIRIKFRDVNKFSTKPGVYTFAFWATSNITLPISIQTYKFFGTTGSPPIIDTQETANISTSPDSPLYQFEINFGLNNGNNIDTVNNDDFVAIDIALPVGVGFVAQFSDFVLTPGNVNVANFPIQTDSDMMTRGVMGWADNVDVTGLDLYLPPILTKEGMIWDRSQIGSIGMDVFPIDDPNATPAPQHNMMPCDGATYITNDYASNGIPFRRLGDFLRRNAILDGGNDLPLYGTGANFVSSLIPFSGANGETMRITYNIAGVGSPLAADGPVGFATGFTFSPMYIYNGSSTGTASLGYFASSYSNPSSPNRVLCVLENGTYLGGVAPTANDSGFTIVDISLVTGILAFQKTAFAVTTVSGAALIKAGTGRSFGFRSSSTQYYMWFNVDGANTDPAAGGIGIQVNVTANYTAQDVADCVREAMNGFQSTLISAPTLPPVGSYFTFSSNPGALRNFYVWFEIDGVGVDPAPVGLIGIKVVAQGTWVDFQIRDGIRGAINSYQYQSPDFRGMFFRAADPNATWDIDAPNRWSYTSQINGAFPGTYEYQQFLNHSHTYTEISPPETQLAAGIQAGQVSTDTDSSGGTETRPVNTYIYPFIRY